MLLSMARDNYTLILTQCSLVNLWFSIFSLGFYTLYSICSHYYLSVYTLYSISLHYYFSVYTLYSLSLLFSRLFQCLYAKFNHLWYLAI